MEGRETASEGALGRVALPEESESELAGQGAVVVERSVLEDVVAVVQELVGAVRLPLPVGEVESGGVGHDGCESVPGRVRGGRGCR